MATTKSKPLAELADEFFTRNASAFAPKTVRDYRKYIAQYIATTSGDLSDLTLDSAIRWRHDLLGRGKNNNVARLGTEALRTFARWLAAAEHLRDPVSHRSVLLGLERTRTTSRKKQALTDEQLDAVWAALDERENDDRTRAIAFVRLVYGTALQRSAIRSILLRNLDRRTRWLSVTVRRKHGTKVRRFRLNRVCAAAVEDYLNDPKRPKFAADPPEPLFITDDGEPFTTDGWGTAVDRVVKHIKTLTDIPWNTGAMVYTAKVHQRSGIHDAVLRRRCAHLLAEERDHDQAIAAACIVLEDRVREKSGGNSRDGDDLMKWALAIEPNRSPRLALAPPDKPNEQWGAFNIYRGVAAFYRNGTTHRTRADDFDPEEAKRIVQWVDHLLGLID